VTNGVCSGRRSGVQVTVAMVLTRSLCHAG